MDMPPVEPADPELVALWLSFFRWVIALLQIVGGLFGVYYCVVSGPSGPSHLLFLLGFVLFVASVWGGILLALNRLGGVTVSLIIQALQVLQIASDGLVYSFFCGAKLVLGFYDFGVMLEYRFPVAFFVSTAPSSNLSSLGIDFTGVNVLAVLAVVCLLFVRASRPKAFLPSSTGEPPTAAGTWPPAPES